MKQNRNDPPVLASALMALIAVSLCFMPYALT
jgi:hypothetical protein